MKRTLAIGVAIAFVGVAFASGFFVRDRFYSSSAEIEDYALANLLGELAYAHYLKQSRYQELRRLIDVNIYGHLSRVRLREGGIKDPDLLSARTLASIADLWEKEPPFQTPDFQQSRNQPWFSDWQQGLEENRALLVSAQAECEKTKCRRPNRSVEGTRHEAARPSLR